MARGRPKGTSTYTEKIAEEICRRISEGEPLQEICREDGMPAWRTVYDWMAANEDFSANIARARLLGTDAIAEGILSIVDEKPPRLKSGMLDQGFVQWQKNRADQRLKLLAKWNPKYGDKIGVEHSGSIELANALEAARKRVSGDGES